MDLPNLPPVPYVKAARFNTLDDARAAFKAIYTRYATPDNRLDIHSVSALYNVNLPVCVVTCLSMPPAEMRASIEQILQAGQSWEPPREFIAAIVMRWLRGALSGQATRTPAGMLRLDHINEVHTVNGLGENLDSPN